MRQIWSLIDIFTLSSYKVRKSYFLDPLLLSSQIKKNSLSLSWVFPLSLSPQSERATQMPARNSAASARGDAPGQNRQARPRLINLFPSHPISLWWHIGRQAEMYDVLKWKCILNAGIWGSSCNVTRVQREKVQGLQRSVPNVGGEKEIQSRNGDLCFFFRAWSTPTIAC